MTVVADQSTQRCFVPESVAPLTTTVYGLSLSFANANNYGVSLCACLQIAMEANKIWTPILCVLMGENLLRKCHTLATETVTQSMGVQILCRCGKMTATQTGDNLRSLEVEI